MRDHDSRTCTGARAVPAAGRINSASAVAEAENPAAKRAVAVAAASAGPAGHIHTHNRNAAAAEQAHHNPAALRILEGPAVGSTCPAAAWNWEANRCGAL